MVKRLVAKGADVSDRNNPFNATPLAWADHGKQTEIFQWMRKHCAVDLHDAVLGRSAGIMLRFAFAKIRRRSTNASIIGACQQSTPLHWAARD